MRNPKWMKALLVIPIYPLLYFGWVNQMKHTWVKIFFEFRYKTT